jgi:pyruvate dehydrogenase (quinone)
LPSTPATLSASVHGDENAWGFAKQGVKQKLQEFLPGTTN